jgi:predicted RNase H-like nuclease
VVTVQSSDEQVSDALRAALARRQAPSGVLAGVDGCHSGWVVATTGPGEGPVALHAVRQIAEVLLSTPMPDVVAIDIPIGLPDSGARKCDLEVRRLLAQRRSSVFPAPIRRALAANSYREACDIRYGVEKKRYSRQTWAVMGKIREVDDVLSSDTAWQEVVHEVHPELCFRKLAGGTPMAYNKKKGDGKRERLEFLTAHFGARLGTLSIAGAGADDVFDALVALWTAERMARGEGERIPSTAEIDSTGLRMEMWT